MGAVGAAGEEQALLIVTTLMMAILLVWSAKIGAEIAWHLVMKQRKKKKITKLIEAQKGKLEMYGSDRYGLPTIIKTSGGWEFI